MFLGFNVRKQIDTYVAGMFSLHRDSIFALHKKQWKDEDIKGDSEVQYKIAQYYYAYYYVILIYLEVCEGCKTDWEYYETKYDIACVRKKLACNQIDLDDILAVFGLPITLNNTGIGGLGVSQTFEVAPFTEVSITIPSESITTLLTIKKECISYIDSSIDQYDYSNNLITI